MRTAMHQMAKHTHLSFLSDLYACFNSGEENKTGKRPGRLWELRALDLLSQETWDIPGKS